MKRFRLLAALTIGLSVGAAGLAASAVPAVADTASARAAQVTPDATCTGSPQRCDVTFQNQDGSKLFLGNNSDRAIVFPYDGGSGQRWDVYSVGGGRYVIYNHNTNNVLASDGSCTSNGGHYSYCAVIQPISSGSTTQEWTELRSDPMVFENVGTPDGRCLDNPGGNAPAGSQVVLYPCSTTDLAQQWAGS